MIVTMISNGFHLSKRWIDRLNEAGLQGMQISIDNLEPDDVSMKSLSSVQGKLALLQKHAKFKVNVNSVLGISTERTEDIITVSKTAASYGLQHSVGVLHNHDGALKPLSAKQMDAYEQGHQDLPVHRAHSELLAVPEEPDAGPRQQLEMPGRPRVTSTSRKTARCIGARSNAAHQASTFSTTPGTT